MSESFLDLNFEDVYEPEVVPDGEEVTVRITKASVEEKKSGSGYNIVVIMEIPSMPKAQDIIQYLPVPSQDLKKEDAKYWNNMMNRIKDFYRAFDVDYANGVDVENDLPGREAEAILRLEDDAQFGRRNTVRKFNVPK